jgi:Mg2+/Co2+ transporter CorC
MPALGTGVVLVVAVFVLLFSILKAALEFSDADREAAEAMGFTRMAFASIFGVLLGQLLAKSGLAWWWATSASVALMLALIFSSQLISRQLGHRGFGSWLLKTTAPLVKSLHLLFQPISLPKDEAPEEFEQELLDSVEEFGETIVREIMVPRVDMATISADSTLYDAMSVFLTRGFSRLPIVGRKIDDIQGVLYIKDVAKIQHESSKNFKSMTVLEIARAAHFVPESKPVDDLLREMQLSSRHISIVVDEYGGVAGLVTLEDLIEEIVGEISDEYDRDAPDLVAISEGCYRMTARYSLFDLGELFGLELEDEDVDTVGGLLTKELGHLPAKGESVLVSGLRLTAEIVEARRKRLLTVKVELDHDLASAKVAFELADKNEQ